MAERFNLVDVTEFGPEYKKNTAQVRDHEDVMRGIMQGCDELVEPDSARRGKVTLYYNRLHPIIAINQTFNRQEPDPLDTTPYDMMVEALRRMAWDSFSDDPKAQRLLERAAQSHLAMSKEYRKYQVSCQVYHCVIITLISHSKC